jgi:hypothetical protein
MKTLNLYYSKHNRFNHPEFYCCEGSTDYVQLEKYYHVIVKKGYSNNPIYMTKKYINITFNRNNLTMDLTPKTPYKIEFQMIDVNTNDKSYINFRMIKLMPIVKKPIMGTETEINLSDSDD